MMQVVDSEKSERGQQRRKDNIGRLLHCCCICGKLEPWSSEWCTYCSVKDTDDEIPIPKFCSAKCAAQGGAKAERVTDEMKRKAKDAEWREPEVVYREATGQEKYNAAASNQYRGHHHPPNRT